VEINPVMGDLARVQFDFFKVITFGFLQEGKYWVRVWSIFAGTVQRMHVSAMHLMMIAHGNRNIYFVVNICEILCLCLTRTSQQVS